MKKLLEKFRSLFEDAEVVYNIYRNAVELNNEEKLKTCLGKGINPNSLLFDGDAALHVVTEHGYENLLDLLLNHANIDINIRNTKCQTPLYIASSENQVECLTKLLEHGAIVDIPDIKVNTPLHKAVLCKSEVIVNILLKYNPNVNCENAFGKTPLYLAAIDCPSIPILKMLIQNGADINVNNGKTFPIIIECTLACHTLQSLEIIELLLDNGADINIYEPYTKRTALHTVAMTGYIPLAKVLVNRGADKSWTEFKGFTPYALAIKYKHTLVAAVLSNSLIRINT